MKFSKYQVLSIKINCSNTQKPKYQVLSDQQGGGGVAEVGCGPRGRPVSLGAYDNLVQVGL